MKAKNLSTALLVGTARMLTLASDFLLHLTEKNAPENPGHALNDLHGRLPADHDLNTTEKWPEAWAQRISEANHVTWFSFNVNKGMHIQHPKPVHTNETRAKKTQVHAPRRIVADTLQEFPQEKKTNPQDMEKKVTSVEANTRSSSAGAPRVFDSKKRFWVRKDHEKPTPQKRENVNPVVNVPEKTMPGVGAPKVSEPFVQHEVQPTEVTLNNNNRLDLSLAKNSLAKEALPKKAFAKETMTEKTPDTARTPVRTWPQDDHILPDSPEMPSDVPGRQGPMPLSPEPVRNHDDLTMDRLSVVKGVGDKPPYSGKWPDFMATGTPPSEPAALPVSYLMQEPGNTQTGRREMFRNEPEPENHWPELENFTAHPESTEIEKNPENPDRILRLKQEQKGSLWSVLRF